MPTKKSIVKLYLAVVARLIAVGLISITNVNAQEPFQAVVALFGDSITQGFNSGFQNVRFSNGTTTLGCTTVYLNNILRDEGERSDQDLCPTESFDSPILDQNNQIRNAIVANWGIGGSNTSQGQNRITSDLTETRNTLIAENYFVLIMYGTNDPAFGISTTTTRFNIQQMIVKARALGYEPIIGTITPRDDIDISPYNSQVVAAANQEGVFVVDHFSRFVNHAGGFRVLLEQEVNPFSGEQVRLHPNDQGYLVIAETWFDQRLKDRIPQILNVNIAPIINLLLED